jgi:outer membrane protein assembly complex protein YaeT
LQRDYFHSVVTWIRAAICCGALSVTTAGFGASETNAKPATIKVSGYGLVGNRQLKRTLSVLEEGQRPHFFTAAAIEDAAFILVSKLAADGYLEPRITAEMTLEDGRVVSAVWDEKVEEPLPRDWRIRKAHFKIRKGVLYYYEEIRFEGLKAIPEKRARTHFVESGGLPRFKSSRIYSPDRLKRGVNNLGGALERIGFQEVKVTATDPERDDRTGKVNLAVHVEPGPRFKVRTVSQEIFVENETTPDETRTNRFDQTYSKLWEQDFVQGIKTNYYRLGYPDTSVAIQTVKRDAVGDAVYLDLHAKVSTGPRIKVHDVRFRGHKRTKETVLARRAYIKEGAWLNRTRAERDRYRLSRLGVFESVDLKYETVDEHTRDVVYELKEGKLIDVSLLAGYGSYEQLRGGVDIEQFNVFGRAHHQRLKLIQSLKSSSADYNYTMPELFRENVDVFFNAFGLRREEISFTREEYGGGAGVRKFYRQIDTDVSVRYNYQVLHATEAQLDVEEEGAEEPGVGAIIIDMHHDRRDNPLYPHKGYKIFANIELATSYLASDVDYQRVDLSGSYHFPVSDNQWLHFGVGHGFIAGDSSQDVPFTRRFFPGGANSIRGFKDGEAAPRNDEGEIVGAETYTFGSIEFEQGITPKFSLVFFGDAVGFARKLSNYPMDTSLFSAGGGVQFRTFIGPLRVEYGYNLNPRRKDPMGTLQVSLGFPF